MEFWTGDCARERGGEGDGEMGRGLEADRPARCRFVQDDWRVENGYFWACIYINLRHDAPT